MESVPSVPDLGGDSDPADPEHVVSMTGVEEGMDEVAPARAERADIDIYLQGSSESEVLQRIHRSYFSELQPSSLHLVSPRGEDDPQTQRVMSIPELSRRTQAEQWQRTIDEWPSAPSDRHGRAESASVNVMLRSEKSKLLSARSQDLAYDKTAHRCEAIISHEGCTAICDMQVKYSGSKLISFPQQERVPLAESARTEAARAISDAFSVPAESDSAESERFMHDSRVLSTAVCLNGFLLLNAAEQENSDDGDEVLRSLKSSQQQYRELIKLNDVRRAVVRELVQVELDRARAEAERERRDRLIEREFHERSRWQRVATSVHAGLADRAVETVEVLAALTVCAVCFDSDSTASNPFMYCDKCTVAVHASCYGVRPVYDEDWKCHRCIKPYTKREECMLCPFGDGAMKPTSSGGWAHLFCSFFFRECSVGSFERMEPINGVAEACAVSASAAQSSVCAVCSSSKGALFRCCASAEVPCDTWFHPMYVTLPHSHRPRARSACCAARIGTRTTARIALTQLAFLTARRGPQQRLCVGRCAWYKGYAFAVNSAKHPAPTAFRAFCAEHAPGVLPLPFPILPSPPLAPKAMVMRFQTLQSFGRNT